MKAIYLAVGICLLPAVALAGAIGAALADGSSPEIPHL